MIVRIFSPTAGFHAVSYNTSKIDSGKGELMLVANFGPLQSLGQLRPEDYKNYLQMIAGLNTRISKPQFHATISAKGKEMSKAALTELAVRWLEAMGYGQQPCLVVFHGDTDNNHVHLVSVRVDRAGKKISSDFEGRRAVAQMAKLVMTDGLEKALSYRVSTVPQFKLLLERLGYVKDVDSELILLTEPDKGRVIQLREIFKKYRDPDVLKAKFGLELVFFGDHAKPFGYTIIDHARQNVFKGGTIMPVKELLGDLPTEINAVEYQSTVNISVNISHDIDDEAVHGRKRRKKQKNLR